MVLLAEAVGGVEFNEFVGVFFGCLLGDGSFFGIVHGVDDEL